MTPSFRNASYWCALVVVALAAVFFSACGSPTPDFTDPKTFGKTREEMQRKLPDTVAYVRMEQAIKKADSARRRDGMPEETSARLTSEAVTAREYAEAAKGHGEFVEDLRVVSALRVNLAKYLDSLAELALAAKMVPKVSPLSPECWTSAPMSSNEARAQREQLLNRAQLSLWRASATFSRTQAGKTPTAEDFRTALISGAMQAFFEQRGIEYPSVEQMEEVYKKPVLRSEFLEFGHCVFWTKDDFTNSVGAAS